MLVYVALNGCENHFEMYWTVVNSVPAFIGSLLLLLRLTLVRLKSVESNTAETVGDDGA